HTRSDRDWSSDVCSSDLSLFHQFALKLVDLWRYEAGLPIDNLFGEHSGWEHFVTARSQKRGVLLLSAHVGNWEFGVPWLARQGEIGRASGRERGEVSVGE